MPPLTKPAPGERANLMDPCLMDICDTSLSSEEFDRLTQDPAAGEGEFTRRVPDLLARGADVNDEGRAGFTALMHAADKGPAGLVRLLLEKGADPDIRDDGGAGWPDIVKGGHEGFTVLSYAVCQGPLAAVRALIEAGADTDIASTKGGTLGRQPPLADDVRAALDRMLAAAPEIYSAASSVRLSATAAVKQRSLRTSAPKFKL